MNAMSAIRAVEATALLLAPDLSAAQAFRDDVLNAGNCGAQGAVALTNVPGSRNSGLAWIGSGGVWVFGGHGFYADTRDGYLNDLWWYLW